MNNLVISVFENESKAEQARRVLFQKDRESSLGLEDAITIEKIGNEEVRFHHLTHPIFVGTIGGTFLGGLLGIILLNPIFIFLGVLSGFILGLLSGASIHIGVNPGFVERETEMMEIGNSALCVMSSGGARKILEELNNFDGLLRTKLCTQSEDLRQCSLWSSFREIPSGLL